MGILALLFGMLGGLCMVMGIITAAEVLEPLTDAFTGMFWLVLGGVLFLASIASSGGRGGESGAYD